jgi:acetyl-CoA carboxylase biotin carboxylase subunit
LNNNKINKLYIANRGEIALRIQRTARKLGIRCCIGISEADKEQSFAKEADETVIIGPAAASLSYLNIAAVISAAIKTGCNAVHPGYGFLSENHSFAEQVIAAGLIWVGPHPETIRLMGSKIEGRKRAVEAKVPVVPGAGGGLSDQELIKTAKKIGCPLIVKAVGGGGGRGMRVITALADLPELLPRARSEALKNFGDDQIFLEKFIETPRHVEVQLLGDQHGNLIHLGTRDCSAQRRHQKLIEEAPAPFISEKMRADIHKAAIAVAKSVNYYSTGTAEFLVEGNKFYFLEMNTRIQVEHPVTELISGLDLIEQQLLVAQGEKLSFKQKDIKLRGHAIEFRINAEDPATQFTPTIGEISNLTLPEIEGTGVRNDFGFLKGDSISVFYDGLIGKIIVYGKTRHEALKKSVTALAQFSCLGLTTNHDFHRWLIRTRIFNEKGIDIGFVGREFREDCLEDLRAAEKIDPIKSLNMQLPAGVRQVSQYVFTTAKGKQIAGTLIEDGSGASIVEYKSAGKALRFGSNSRYTALEACREYGDLALIKKKK